MSRNFWIFHGIFWSIHIGLFAFGFWKQMTDSELSFLNQIGLSVYTSRAAGMVMAFDAAALLLGVLRNIITLLMSTFLYDYIPFHDSIYFHKWTAYSLALNAFIHVNAHYLNFFIVEYLYEIRSKLDLEAWQIHFTTWGGVTGHIMVFVMLLMYTSASSNVRKANFEVFWYTHHLFIPFFAAFLLHSKGCFVHTNTGGCKPYFSYAYAAPILFLYFVERLLVFVRARRPTKLKTVVFHPGNVLELRISKPSLKFKAGQYVYLNVPQISRFQWHPFTISSCPEEQFISLHIRIVGDWTKNLAKLLQSYQSIKDGVDLPQVRLDGSYGTAAESISKYRIAVLIGAGIGVTPSASILRSAWFKFCNQSTMNMKRLHFIWITREIGELSWFQALMASLEEKLSSEVLEMQTYVTGKQATDDIQNILMNSQKEYDPVTELKSKNNYGRPVWSKYFKSVAQKAPQGVKEIGVFFCGPAALARVVKDECDKNSTSSIKFIMQKERFG
jgi:NADPH oxidase